MYVAMKYWIKQQYTLTHSYCDVYNNTILPFLFWRLLAKYNFMIKRFRIWNIWLLQYHSRPCFVHEATETEGHYTTFFWSCTISYKAILTPFPMPIPIFPNNKIAFYLTSSIISTLQILTDFILQQCYKIINCPHLYDENTVGHKLGMVSPGSPCNPDSRHFSHPVMSLHICWQCLTESWDVI